MSSLFNLIMFSGFISVVAHISASFLVMAVYYSVVLMRHLLFLHLSGDGHVGFHLLAAVDSAVTNVCV